MSRPSFASIPFLLGFEDLDHLVERSARSASESYPPYNIEAYGEHSYRIVLAVAGFAQGDLSVQMEGNQLIIQGTGSAENTDEYLHRGISNRNFRRNFVLDSRVEVTKATLDRGLLTIDLIRRPPEQQVQTIRIGTRE